MEASPQYINELRVSQITGRAVQSLRNDRVAKRGIPYIKMGRSVRYDLRDVIRFMESRKVWTRDARRLTEDY